MDSRTNAVDLPAGFYGESLAIRLCRLALQGSQQLWPGLAVRAAARLFSTPLPPKWLHRGDWPASIRTARPCACRRLATYSIARANCGRLLVLPALRPWAGSSSSTGRQPCCASACASGSNWRA